MQSLKQQKPYLYVSTAIRTRRKQPARGPAQEEASARSGLRSKAPARFCGAPRRDHPFGPHGTFLPQEKEK